MSDEKGGVDVGEWVVGSQGMVGPYRIEGHNGSGFVAYADMATMPMRDQNQTVVNKLYRVHQWMVLRDVPSKVGRWPKRFRIVPNLSPWTVNGAKNHGYVQGVETRVDLQPNLVGGTWYEVKDLTHSRVVAYFALEQSGSKYDERWFFVYDKKLTSAEYAISGLGAPPADLKNRTTWNAHDAVDFVVVP